MNLSDSPDEILTEDELVDALFHAGNTLKGKNLRRSSWQEIASFVRGSGSLPTAMWQRLQNAETREDALRVLRIIRKRAKQQTSSRGAGSRITTSVNFKKELNADWQSEVETDEYWDYLRPRRHPWCYCGNCDEYYAPCERTVFSDAFRFFVASLRILASRRWQGTKLKIPPQNETVLSEDLSDEGFPRESRDPIEVRLSRHLKAASKRVGDAEFEESISKAIGEDRNLDVVKAAICGHRLRVFVCGFSPFWIRSPMSWDGTTNFLNHLFVRNAVPEWLQNELNGNAPEFKWLCWFILLGQNGSLRRAAKHFSWQIPRRLQHHLANAPSDCTPIEAVMYAEITRMGGNDTDFCRLRYATFIVDPTEPSDQPNSIQFWQETARWFVANHDAIRDDQTRQILDWAVHEYTEANRQGGIPFSWKGRAVRTTVRRSEDYRVTNSRNRHHANYQWAGHDWDTEIERKRLATGQSDSTVWSFTELTSGEELFREGQAQCHCVASYATLCVAGHSAIFSMKCNGKRCLTVEICPEKRVVLQARGRFNRNCASEEQTVINEWLRKTVRSDLA